MRMNTAIKSIDEYLKPLSAPNRTALEALRTSIRAAAPKAVEAISYGMPSFRLDGKALVYFGAAARHCSFYPGSSRVIENFKDALADFETSKGTIRFSPEKPLPSALVKKIVKARVAEHAVVLEARRR